MERKRFIFHSSLQTILKILLNAGLSFLLVFVHHHNFTSASTIKHQARILTELGYEQLQKGLAQEALTTWSKSYEIYQKLNDSNGVSGSLINQSLALKALSLYPHACQNLIQALSIDDEDWICSSSQGIEEKQQQEDLVVLLKEMPQKKIQIIGLENLGNVLRLIGKAEESELVLKKALAITNNIPNASELVRNDILLTLANTERSLYEKDVGRYNFIDEPLGKQKALESALSKFENTLELYQQASRSNDLGTKLKAQLNWLDLLLNSDFNTPQKIVEIQYLTKQLLTDDFKQLPAIESIYDQIKFSKALIQIVSDPNLNRLIPDLKLTDVALSSTLSALEQAEKINHKRSQSLSLGILSKIYRYLGEIEKSEKCLTKALSLAQSIQSWDFAYRWQRELGSFYKEVGKIEEAKNFYGSAIASIEKIQSNSLLFNSEIRFNFKDKIEPVYQEYLELLLSENRLNFKEIIEAKQQLQLAEIRNFLQCNHLPLITEREIAQNSTNKIPTIYIFRLKNRVEIIVKTLNKSFFRHSIKLEEVNDSIEDLTRVLQLKYFSSAPQSQLLNYSQDIYQRLIAPIKKYLPEKGSLLFVVDTYFQKIPFSMLYDGEKYLLENYDISVSLSSQQQEIALTSKNLKALIAGVYKSNPNFSHSLIKKNLTPLPEVKTEISNVKLQIKNRIELINANFSQKNFRDWMITRKSSFPIIHISTHGQFSSDPEKTFVLAWDKPINVRKFEYLLKNHPSSIELLVLSACQTAKGDKHSALGIAGIATMSGAKSTLASLWLVDAQSTSGLMGDFYKELKNNGFKKAQALRKAQLNLLRNPKYSHPYYWAPFILVNR